ncbi:hypothetical protein KJ359_000066 [Pestalotiopsis sp. 9143b]|nr:hypothetical protein KJ359_000066 [Pestalotiopsis sp. 9143b]
MSSGGDPDPLEEPGSPARMGDQPDSGDNIERDLLAALGAEMNMDHEPAPVPSPDQDDELQPDFGDNIERDLLAALDADMDADNEAAPVPSPDQDNESQPGAAVDAPSRGSSPGNNAAAIPNGANEPEDRDNGPDKQDKDKADDALDGEDDGTEFVFEPGDSDQDTDVPPDHDLEDSDLETVILNDDPEDKERLRSLYSVPALFGLGRRMRHARYVLERSLAEMQQREEENRREAVERHNEINRQAREIRRLEERLERRNNQNQPQTSWLQTLQEFFLEPVEGGWEGVFAICCHQTNMSRDPTNVHPDLRWADVFVDLPDAAEEQNDDPVELFDDEDEASLGDEAESAVIVDDVAEVEPEANIENSAVRSDEPEVRDFPFDKLPFNVQQRIMEYVFVKPGVIHCLSRLDKRVTPEQGMFPYPCSGTSGLPHRFAYGTRPWSIEESPRPDLELQPLLVSKRWLYLGVHAFYALNTFAFSSLGEFGRFFNGIGPQRTQRVAHVEVHWQGSVMRAHPTRINQRTLPLNHLTRMRRLQTLTLFIEESAERRIRRAYEFPKESEVARENGEEQAGENGSRRRRDNFDFSARYLDLRRNCIDDLNPPKSLLKRTATHANWRGNRSMRTTHGMDYIYALRGLQWVRVYEHGHGPARKLIRDFTFLDDVNKVVTLPKDERHQVESDLRNLIRPKGIQFYQAENEDAAMVARWYELGTLPIVHGGSDAASNTSGSDPASGINLDDPASPSSTATSKSHESDDDYLDLVNRMVFPDEIGYQHKRGQLHTPAPTREASPVDEDEDGDIFMLRGVVLPDEPGFRHEPISDDAKSDASEDDGDSDDELEALIRNSVLPDEAGHQHEPAHEPESDVSMNDSDSEDAAPTVFTTFDPLGSVHGTAPSEWGIDVPQIQRRPADKDRGEEADDEDDLFVNEEKSSAPHPSHQFLRPSVPASALGRAKSEAIDLTGDEEEEEQDVREREQSRMSSPSVASTDVSGSMYAHTVVGTVRSFKRESTAGGDAPETVIDLTADDDDDDDGSSHKLPFAPPTNIIYDDDRNGERSQSVIDDDDNGNKAPGLANDQGVASNPGSADINNDESIPEPGHNDGDNKVPGPTSPVPTSSPKRSLEDDDGADIQDNVDSQDEASQEDRGRTKSPGQPQPKRRKGNTGFIISPSPPPA